MRAGCLSNYARPYMAELGFVGIFIVMCHACLCCVWTECAECFGLMRRVPQRLRAAIHGGAGLCG